MTWTNQTLTLFAGPFTAFVGAADAAARANAAVNLSTTHEITRRSRRSVFVTVVAVLSVVAATLSAHLIPVG